MSCLNVVLAYLDPGSGSYILQLLLAALFGSLFAIKLFWRRILGFFKNMGKSDRQV